LLYFEKYKIKKPGIRQKQKKKQQELTQGEKHVRIQKKKKKNDAMSY